MEFRPDALKELNHRGPGGHKPHRHLILVLPGQSRFDWPHAVYFDARQAPLLRYEGPRPFGVCP